jgi:hypothetical protein
MHETISAKTSCDSKTNSLDRPPARRREASYMDRSFYLVGSMLAKIDCVASIRICPKTVLRLKQTWKASSSFRWLVPTNRAAWQMV